MHVMGVVHFHKGRGENGRHVFDRDVQCKDKVFVQGQQYTVKLRGRRCLKRKDLLCDMEGGIEPNCQKRIRCHI